MSRRHHHHRPSRMRTIALPTRNAAIVLTAIGFGSGLLAITTAIGAVAAALPTAAHSLRSNIQDGSTGLSAPRLHRVTQKTTAKKKNRRNLQRIEVLVNDQPITGYEINQRAALLALNTRGIGQRIKSRAAARWKRLIKDPSLNKKFEAELRRKNVKSREEAKKVQVAFIKRLQRQMVDRIKRDEQAKARQGSRKKAVEALIEEKLKLQEAKRLNLLADDETVDKAILNIAQKNKMDLKQFAAHLRRMGTNINTMRSRFRSLISWQNVVRRRFGFQVSMLSRDVDRYMDQNIADGDVDLRVHRITLPLGQSAGQGDMAQQLQVAEAARQSFRGCQTTKNLAQSLPGAQFEDLGQLKSSAVAEPTRSMLLAAGDGDMLPPTLAGSQGIQLWAVCGRNTVALETKKRVKEQGELRQREFSILAQKHLKDLRQDATIVYR